MPRATSLSVMNNSTMRAGDLTGLLEIINKTVPSKRSLGFELDLQGQHPFLTISGPPALTNISIAARNWTDAHIGFVRYHCDTLRMLTVHNITTWSFEQLLVDGERSNIVYPNLLVLDAELRLSMQAPSLNLQRTPFPALRCLRNKGFYPFNSDIALYTGHPSTLEYLRLPLDTVLFNTLSASNAFKSRKYPVLRTAEIFFNNSPFVVAEAVQGWSMFATIFEIAEAAKVFRCNIRVNRSAPVLINMRPSFSLEHLYLPWFGIDLAGFPLLCLKFPKLRSVACTLIDAIDGISEDMPKDESIQAALSTKRIRSKLATLEIFGETWVRNYRRFAQYVVLLVALLPSVKELVYWPYASEEAPEAKRQLTAALNRTAYRDMYHVKTLKVDIKTHYTYLEDVYRKQFPLQ
ncbi:hypothetical protein EC988_002438 [Linderina pennispora]|nr:hypothetical protein EC988_002438 [Linderina pennispora]